MLTQTSCHVPAGKGYLEDRRPAANVDPYTVARLLIKSTLLA